MKRLFSALTLSIFCLFSLNASAQGPCDGDLQKFCKDVKPGEGRQVTCLWKNRANLSKTCKAQAQKDRATWKAAQQTCKADAKKFCKDVTPGGGRLHACLKGRYDDLKPKCQATLDRGKKVAKAWQGACKADAKTHCKGVKPGKGRVLACLVENKDKVSQPCRDRIERKTK